MLTVIQNLPDHIFGVRASGEVTKEDLKMSKIKNPVAGLAGAIALNVLHESL